jgi:type II secretory ATPase GspE/PulE/Tfp pilus assembly ATPase PilB-like protein
MPPNDVMPTSTTIPESIQPAVVSSSSTTAEFDLAVGHASIADSIAEHSAATVRTKNNKADEETTIVSLLQLIEMQEWRLCMSKVETEPKEARIRAKFRIEGEMTQGYLLHLAVSKNPPVGSIFFYNSKNTCCMYVCVASNLFQQSE